MFETFHNYYSALLRSTGLHIDTKSSFAYPLLIPKLLEGCGRLKDLLIFQLKAHWNSQYEWGGGGGILTAVII